VTPELIAIAVIVLTAVTMPWDAVGTLLGLFSLKGLLVAVGVAGLAWGLGRLIPTLVAGAETGGVAVLTIAVGFALVTLVNKIREHLEFEREWQHKQEQARERDERGVDVEARITRLERTGLKVNDQPQIELHVEAELPDGRSFEGGVTMLADEDQLDGLEPGATLGVRLVPDDPENFELRLDEPRAGTTVRSLDELLAASEDGEGDERGDERPSMTGAPIPWPLWIFGLQDAEAWLLPPRREDALPLAIVDLCDPYEDGSTPEREAVVDSAAYWLAERVWIQTDLPVSAAVFVAEAQRKVMQPTGSMFEYDALVPFLTTLEPFPAVARGEAGEDLDTDGLTLKLRLPDDPAERTLTAPVGELPGMLIDWLVRKGLCQRIEPPAWYAAPGPELLADYARALDNLQLQVIADKNNRFIERQEAEAHERYVEHAFAMLERHPDAGAQVLLLAAGTAHYAERDGRLGLVQRQQALDLINGVTDPEHPLYRISPLLLHVHREPVRAASRRKALRDRAEGAYAEWLDALELD